jgi:vacuolar-type H+-ATPase subunit H
VVGQGGAILRDISVAEKSAIQRIKDLDAERAGIFDQAKEETLEKAKAPVARAERTQPRLHADQWREGSKGWVW